MEPNTPTILKLNNNLYHEIDEEDYNIKKELKYYEKGEIISNPILDYEPFKSVRGVNSDFIESVYLQTFMSQKHLISLGAGEPNPDSFPLKEIKLHVKNLDREIVISGEEMRYIQSYDKVPGYYKLVNWLTEYQKESHGLQDSNIKGREWKLLITHGSQCGLDIIFKSFFDRNDSIITESFTFGGLFAICAAQGVNYAGIDIDERGIIPKNLERVLKNWKVYHKGCNFPKALYTIPNAQNPTGAQYDLQRKIEIYNICSKYNLLIIEDDPHYQIVYQGKKDVHGRFIGEPSMLAIDVDKRVIRIDTFSKSLTSGIRLGWVTTWSNLYSPLIGELNNSLFHPSNLTQVIVYRMLESWGIDGYHKYLKGCQESLIKKRDFMISCFEKYLKGLVEWNYPKGGLYIFAKLLGIEDSNHFVLEHLHPNKLLLSLGMHFSSIQNHKTNLVRFTFSYLSNEEVESSFIKLQKILLNYKNNINNNINK